MIKRLLVLRSAYAADWWAAPRGAVYISPLKQSHTWFPSFTFNIADFRTRHTTVHILLLDYSFILISMAPSARTRRQRSKPKASIETPAHNAHLLSDGNNSSNDCESSSTGHEPDGTISLVAALWMPIPRTYNPETYDPKRRVQWTLEPEAYDPDTYAAWSRKHFGDDWYDHRKTMLQESNTYAPDAAYKRRERDFEGDRTQDWGAAVWSARRCV